MALVRDECLLPCKDAPELGFAKESTPEQYVPDVFYKVRAPECFCGAAARHTSGQDDRTSRHSSEAGCLESAQPDVVIWPSFCFHLPSISKDKDKFGNDVTFLARPLPVEYLIIDVSSFHSRDVWFSHAPPPRPPHPIIAIAYCHHKVGRVWTRAPTNNYFCWLIYQMFSHDYLLYFHTDRIRF